MRTRTVGAALFFAVHAVGCAGASPSGAGGPNEALDGSTVDPSRPGADAGSNDASAKTDASPPPPVPTHDAGPPKHPDAAAPVDSGSTPAVDASSAVDAGAGPVAVDAGSDADVSPEQLCVDLVNQYRATLGLPPYTRWNANESCVDGQALADGNANKAHSAFGKCNEWGQCECPGWSGSYQEVLKGCLAAMWAEGPGGGHYDIMSSKSYTQVACGFATLPSGAVWATQDYK